MESEWIEYDSAGYPHKRPAPLGNCDSQQSEQPQGEATPDTNCGRCFGSGQYTRDGFGGKDFKSCECVTSAQTEGGEKPKSPCCHLTMRDDTAFYTCSCGRHWIPVELSLPTKWREIESASPPSQPAGGAREWRLRMDLLGVSQHDFWDDMRAQGYAEQRVLQVRYEANKAAYEHYELTVEKLRQERDALKKEMTLAENSDGGAVAAIVGPILREIYGESVELGHYKAAIAAWKHGRSGTLAVMGMFGREREARERAEKALREATRDGKWIYCTVKRHDALAELAEALAHVKSSEGAK